MRRLHIDLSEYRGEGRHAKILVDIALALVIGMMFVGILAPLLWGEP